MSGITGILKSRGRKILETSNKVALCTDSSIVLTVQTASILCTNRTSTTGQQSCIGVLLSSGWRSQALFLATATCKHRQSSSLVHLRDRDLPCPSGTNTALLPFYSCGGWFLKCPVQAISTSTKAYNVQRR